MESFGQHPRDRESDEHSTDGTIDVNGTPTTEHNIIVQAVESLYNALLDLIYKQKDEMKE